MKSLFIFFLDALVHLFPLGILNIFIRKPLALVVGDHDASRLKIDPGRKQLETKHVEKTIYGPPGVRGII
jgi:hypothetical protein